MSFGHLSAQEYELVDTYEEYIDAPREVVYLHLNKSTYIKGESIGFTAYVLDKRDKRPSLLTTNLYVSIEDTNHKIVKQKLIKVNNGIASNVFNVDSLFNSGYYNIKAYTNWMRNFNEPNYYNESIRVIDPEKENFIEKPIVNNDIDAQFLPESGHLLNGILNKVGVIVKDNQGFGVPNTKGEVIDQNNKVLTAFTTNELGIGSFFLIADTKTNYSVKINHANEDFNFPLGQTVEKNGIILSVKRLKTKLYVSVTTNEDTFGNIKSKRHTLLIHNGSGYEVMDIYFTDAPVINKVIEFNSIPAGVNILTLFDENEKPIAERMFFNYEGINIEKSDKVSATGYGDSLNVKLNFKNVNPQQFNNISVSVLPEETESYNRHSSLLSQTFLQPYLKGYIENSRYYFENIDQKKQFDLDNLLITQGWSSYDWNNMFLPDELPHPFEQGILIKGNINNQDHLNDVFVLHHSRENPPQYKQTSDGNKSIIFDSNFPVSNDDIFISRIDAPNNLLPAQLYVQTFPSTIPNLPTKVNPLKPKDNYKIIENLNMITPLDFNLNKVQKLDEVVVESRFDKELVRARKLAIPAYVTVKIPSELDKLTFMYLQDYLMANRIYTHIRSQTQDLVFSTGLGSGTGMLVYYNDIPLISTNFLYRYPMAEIDRIEINRRGFGGGARGANGILKIYTSQESMFSSSNKVTAQDYKLPLTFSEKKTFYTPKYQYYNDEFFKGYGTIDWKPELILDNQGNVEIKIKKPQVPITLFIEGINGSSFIYCKKTLELN
jgi:hypothetical protein